MKNLILLGLVIVSYYSCKQKKINVPVDERPNIVLIISDDMGYSDLAPYGGEINTPNLTALAEGGLKFTQFYNTARCCPSRASLMTGCYPQQAGIGHMTNTPNNKNEHNYGVPEYQGKLSSNTITIAEVLRESGYSTLMSGKWHLSFHDKNQWPMQRGFNKFYGFIAGAGNYFKPEAPRNIYEGNEIINIVDKNYYTTDVFTDKAIEYINTTKGENKEKPFFLYLAYNAPHWPLQAPKEDIDKYRGKYMNGWEAIRLQRYERMKDMGIIDPSWNLSYDNIVSWNSLDEEKKQEMDLRMAIYAAMVDRMDQNIGRLVSALKAKNLYDNTIIMFLNDNGACAEFDELGSGPKEQLETKEGYALTYGKAWANASNTPYRMYKHWLHEGGIATPFIVHWPKGISKDIKGSIVNQYGFLPDIMATCLDLAETEQPKEYNGNIITQHSGESLKPLFSGMQKQLHTEPIFWEHEGNKAVRLGNYKLVQEWKEDKKDDWELYDLEKDRTETINLIMEIPDKANEMIAMYNAWATKIKVLPWDEVNKIRAKKRGKAH
jgi:arylsulfatase A-like enzyme